MEGGIQARRATRQQSFTRGVHHLALCTDDMKATTEFYTRVLGMPLIHAMKVPHGLGTGPGNRGNPPYEDIRHYFFDMGNDSLIAFFEIPKGKEPKGNRNAIGAMQHCAFVVTPAVSATLPPPVATNPSTAAIAMSSKSRIASTRSVSSSARRLKSISAFTAIALDET